jgi:hypothetical protein
MQSPFWADTPPPSSPHVRARLARIPSKGEAVALLTGEALVGVWTHWFQSAGPRGGRRSCLGRDCPCAELPLESRWYGYISVASRDRGRWVLELPASGARHLLALVSDATSLRGLRVRFRRTLVRPDSPVAAEIVERLDPTACPPSFDVRPHLLRMWRVDHRVGDLTPLWSHQAPDADTLVGRVPPGEGGAP